MSNRRKTQSCLSDEAVERLMRMLTEENFEAFRAEWEKLLPYSQEEDD